MTSQNTKSGKNWQEILTLYKRIYTNGCSASLVISSVSSVTQLFQLFVTPWTTACQASLSITNSQSLLKLMSIESVKPSNHLILCHHLLLLPSIFHRIRVRVSASTSVLPNEYSGLISFRIEKTLMLGKIEGRRKR